MFWIGVMAEAASVERVAEKYGKGCLGQKKYEKSWENWWIGKWNLPRCTGEYISSDSLLA